MRDQTAVTVPGCSSSGSASKRGLSGDEPARSSGSAGSWIGFGIVALPLSVSMVFRFVRPRPYGVLLA
jgi:hypothetical protein